MTTDLDFEPTDPQVLRDLRRERRRRRIADLEWFEVAYRVYLVALIGGGIVLWLSSYVTDEPLGESSLATFRDRAPGIIGFVAALALVIGLRSGSHGGPIAIEEGDVRHVLMAPVDRGAALRLPAWQRVRSALFTGSAVGAIGAEIAARRMNGHTFGWLVAGAATGLTLGAAYVGGALIAHAARRPQWWFTVIGGTLLLVQGAAAFHVLPAGPLDTVGSLFLWPLRVRPIDLVAPVIALALVVVGLRTVHRMSLEALARRSTLVTQLRFAATMQDLRTVMLLRRQLSLEVPRSRPWLRVGRHGSTTWRRGWRSVMRFPPRRVGRIVSLCAAAAACGVAAYRGWTVAALAGGFAWFLVGLEAIEPLSQELDHSERTDLMPVDTGLLHHRLFAVPSVVLAVLGMITGAAAGAIAAPAGGRGLGVLVGVLLGAPAAVMGGVGAAFNAVGGVPDPFTASTAGAVMPPEIAGFGMVIKTAFPIVVAILGSLATVLVREGVSDGQHPLAVAARAAIALVVASIVGAWWLRSRPRFRRWWHGFKEEAMKSQQSSGRAR